MPSLNSWVSAMGRKRQSLPATWTIMSGTTSSRGKTSSMPYWIDLTTTASPYALTALLSAHPPMVKKKPRKPNSATTFPSQNCLQYYTQTTSSSPSLLKSLPIDRANRGSVLMNRKGSVLVGVEALVSWFDDFQRAADKSCQVLHLFCHGECTPLLSFCLVLVGLAQAEESNTEHCKFPLPAPVSVSIFGRQHDCEAGEWIVETDRAGNHFQLLFRRAKR